MRQAVLNLEESMIRQVVNAGMKRGDGSVLVRRSDEVTPAFIREAAMASRQKAKVLFPQPSPAGLA